MPYVSDDDKRKNPVGNQSTMKLSDLVEAGTAVLGVNAIVTAAAAEN